MKIKVVRDILAANEQIAEDNRKAFHERGVFVINLMGSPGAGKTSLLERTVAAFQGKIGLAVIEGDIASSQDAERIARLGVPAIQINTGGACHLDANMIRVTLDDLNLEELDLLFIENVGNLVCPAEFQLGEDLKVAVLSVTEGDDKPQKYPMMFRESAALVINKVDLLPYVSCSVERIQRDTREINPDIRIFRVSCTTGEGLSEWAGWLEGKAQGLKPWT